MRTKGGRVFCRPLCYHINTLKEGFDNDLFHGHRKPCVDDIPAGGARRLEPRGPRCGNGDIQSGEASFC